MIQVMLTKFGLSFLGNALKKHAGPIILITVIVGAFTFAGWKYHSLYVMAMDTKVELAEVNGRLNRVLTERAQYLLVIDDQNKGLADLKKRTAELQDLVDGAKERLSLVRDKYKKQITLVEDVTFEDDSCEGVMQWMADDAKEAAKW